MFEMTEINKVDMAIYEGLIEESDFEGYTDEKSIVPYISIRQKPKQNEKGKILDGFESGKFCLKKSDPNIAEILKNVVIVATGKQRVYFTDGNLQCKSDDCIVNIRGEYCIDCPYGANTWAENGDPPKCKEGRKLVIIWNDEPYILVFGPGSLKSFAEFESTRKKIRIKFGKKSVAAPLHFLKLDIEIKFINGKKGDYFDLEYKNIRLITEPEELQKIKGIHQLAAEEIMPKVDIASNLHSENDEDDGDLPF